MALYCFILYDALSENRSGQEMIPRVSFQSKKKVRLADFLFFGPKEIDLFTNRFVHKIDSLTVINALSAVNSKG